MEGADVGHRSGKEREVFHRIMVKTTGFGFPKGLEINFKHMSSEVLNKGHSLIPLVQTEVEIALETLQ